MGTLAGIMASAYGGHGASEAPWAASVHVDGATITTNQLLPGFAGAYDATTNVNRVYMAPASAGSLMGGSLWSAIINGSAATLKLRRLSGGMTNAIYASIDGGAFAAITASGTNPTFSFPLFTGLSDAEHHVVIRLGSAYGSDQVYFEKTLTDALTITGTAPYIEACNQWVYAGVANANALCAGMTVASTANWTPARSKQNIVSLVSNISAARIKGKFRSIQVASTGAAAFTKVFVSKNGAAPTEYSFTDPGLGGTVYRVTGLTEEIATYIVWTNHEDCSMFAVSGDADHVTIGTQRQLHQFGDSITHGGNPAGVIGAVDVLRVGAAMGFAAVTAGVSGNSIQQIDTNLTTYLAALTVTSDDVAIVAAGRNNTGGAFDATETAAYQSIISKLVTKGYGTIICRGILPSADHVTVWTAENGSISSIVSGVGNPDVVYCDVNSCPVYGSADGTHPNAAGYATIAAFVEPLYRAILGL